MSELAAVVIADAASNGICETRNTKHNFTAALRRSGVKQLRRLQVRDLQVNVGKLCNQACNHCHVDAGPKRTEIMSRETMFNIVQWVLNNEIKTVDITGGAPEMVPGFRDFVESLRSTGAEVISRCNLTVLFEPNQDDLASWYAANHVKLICSLPCYTKDNLEAQRGKGVFDMSIRGLQRLNQNGYGINPRLTLDLVYNPNGAFLPPAQSELEATYKLRLSEDFQIQFNQLFTLTNLPISRFSHYLRSNSQYDTYLDLLSDNFNPATIDGLMCRHILSVDWLGRIFDCDFNQMLGMNAGWKQPRFLWDVRLENVRDDIIAVDSHCFGCTAGSGSSCTGSLA